MKAVICGVYGHTMSFKMDPLELCNLIRNEIPAHSGTKFVCVTIEYIEVDFDVSIKDQLISGYCHTY